MQYPGYAQFEGIDASNWPIWLISFILAAVMLVGIIAIAVRLKNRRSRKRSKS